MKGNFSESIYVTFIDNCNKVYSLLSNYTLLFILMLFVLNVLNGENSY